MRLVNCTFISSFEKHLSLRVHMRACVIARVGAAKAHVLRVKDLLQSSQLEAMRLRGNTDS